MIKFILPIWLAIFTPGEPQPTAPVFTGQCFTNSDGSISLNEADGTPKYQLYIECDGAGKV
jgi:hypothetical protein